MSIIKNEYRLRHRSRNIVIQATLAVCLCLMSSCLVLEGSDQAVVYTVSPGQGLTSLQIHNSFQVKVQAGSQNRFEFRVDDNLRAFVDAREEEPGEWTLRLLPGVDYKPKNLTVTVTVNSIERLIVNEDASVEVSGFNTLSAPIKIMMSDSAKLRWKGRVEVNTELNLELKDETQVEFEHIVLTPTAKAICRCQGGQLAMSGTGNSFSLSAKQQHKANLKEFVVQNMDVELSETSTAEVNAVKTLSVSLFDRTFLLYNGNPEVTIKVKNREATLTQQPEN